MLPQQLPIPPANVMQIAMAEIACWVAPIAIPVLKHRAAAKFPFHQLRLNEQRPRLIFSLYDQIDGCRLPSILIENLPVLHLEFRLHLTRRPGDPTHFKSLLQRSQIALHDQRPHQVEQHRLAAQSMVDVFMQWKPCVEINASFLFGLNMPGDLGQDDVPRPILPPLEQVRHARVDRIPPFGEPLRVRLAQDCLEFVVPLVRPGLRSAPAVVGH